MKTEEPPCLAAATQTQRWLFLGLRKQQSGQLGDIAEAGTGRLGWSPRTQRSKGPQGVLIFRPARAATLASTAALELNCAVSIVYIFDFP